MPTLPSIGVDLVDCDRLRRILEKPGDLFLRRVFTAGEIARCSRMADPVPHFAARFAAKEAVAKAFGTGIGAMAALQDIEVVNDASGAPAIILGGAAARTAAAMGVAEVKISLSHTAGQAVAMAMLCG